MSCMTARQAPVPGQPGASYILRPGSCAPKSIRTVQRAPSPQTRESAPAQNMMDSPWMTGGYDNPLDHFRGGSNNPLSRFQGGSPRSSQPGFDSFDSSSFMPQPAARSKPNQWSDWNDVSSFALGASNPDSWRYW